MSQADQVVENLTPQGGSFRGELNTQLAALFSSSSGPAEPTVMSGHQLWADTTNALLKLRNPGNTAWLDLLSITASALLLRPSLGSAALPAFAFSGDEDTGMYRVAPDVLAVALGGVLAARFDPGTTSPQPETAITREKGDVRYPNISSGTGAPTSTPGKVNDLYVDTANNIVYVARGSVSSADWKRIDPFFVAKNSDQSKTTDTTLANDTELSMTLPTGRFSFEACIFTAAGSGQVELGFTVPGGGSSMWWNKTGTDGVPVLSGASTITVTDTSTGTVMTMLKGQLRNLVADGTFALRWAQASSDAAASTVKLNSWMQVRKMAG